MGQWRQSETGSQKHQRVFTTVPVRISTVDAERDPDSGKRFFRSTETTTANLSRGGAFVHSWEPLAAGQRVVVTFTLPQAPDAPADLADTEIQVLARVVWTRRELRQADSQEIQPPGYGLEFIGGTPAEVAALDVYLNSTQKRIKPTPAATLPGNAPNLP